jgi:hypothetical protein
MRAPEPAVGGGPDLRRDPVGQGFSAFVTDVFSRRIVGWRVAARMPTELPLDRCRWRCGSAPAPVTPTPEAGSRAWCTIPIDQKRFS